MRYVLGTESEAMEISSDAIAYGPGGLGHAVDTAALEYHADHALGYALCGRPVRAWSEIAFDHQAATNAHDECVALAARTKRRKAVAASR
jgi:hypothetical protein